MPPDSSPPTDNLVFHHQVGNVFEPDGTLVQPAAVFGSDAIHHAGRIERADHIAGPLLAFHHPAQQNRETLMRIHEAAVFGYGADAIRIAIGRQPGMALFFQHGFPQHFNVRLNGLRIDSGKQWI